MSEEESELAAVFFCEFDNSVGRTLAFQEPAGFISADAFDAISEFLIPKPQLCGRLLVLREEGRVVLCWPVCIEDPRYARNALLFSLGFVLEPGTASGAPERYGRVLEKASRHLEVLEKESRLLSGGSREVQHMLPQLLHDLRKHGRCSIAADASNTLELSLPQPLPARPAGSAQIGAQDHMTPLLVAEPDAALVRGWDLTLQRLLPQLDGTRTVACVAAAVGADLPLARRALETLAAGGWVRMLDTFCFSNAYACTPRLTALALAPAAERQRAADACGRAGAPPPPFACVLKLLSAFQPMPNGEGWRTVLGVCTLYPQLCEGVDVRRLVQFALLNRLIRRVHCYPIVPQLSHGATPPQPSPAGEEWPPGPRHARAAAATATLAAGLDGQRDMDSVCCALEMPCAAAQRAVLEAYPDCVFVHR